MSDASQGEGWWLASDGKWYPPQLPPPPPAPAYWSPPAGPPRIRPSWELTQEQLRWKAEHRRGARNRWADLSTRGRITAALVAVLVAGAVTTGIVLSQPTTEPARDLARCQDAAGTQMSANSIIADPDNPASVEIFSAYVNRCIALREGIDPCGWALRATSGDKPVAGCGRFSSLPLAGFRPS